MTALNNITTADRYTGPTTLLCPLSGRLRLFVRNAAIYRQLGQGLAGGALEWQDELFTPPGNYSFDGETFHAVRVRSVVAGVPAQVSLEGTPP